MATRQTSSSGRPKSPRIQVVLSEELLEQLTAVADADCRTVSNLARVLIQLGGAALERHRSRAQPAPQRDPAERHVTPERQTERFRAELERQEQAKPSRLRGAPRRLRLQRPRES
ncbi:MAG: ribbon-helix-helix domain-containing protein [Cyanobacteriota bacterium]